MKVKNPLDVNHGLEFIYENPSTYDGKDQFQNRQHHFVFLALGGLNQYSTYVKIIGNLLPEENLPEEEIDAKALSCNNNNEVISLYPNYNCTIIPLSKYQDRNDFEDINTMKRHVKSILNENEENIKSSRITILLDTVHDFDSKTFIMALSQEIHDSNYGITKTIKLYMEK